MANRETIETLKRNHDLRDLASAYTTLKKESSTEMSGPCPKCGGDDRFHCKAEWFFCRQCYPPDNSQAHDVIAFVMWAEELDFRAAVDRLGGDLAQKGRKRLKKAQPQRLTITDNGPPPILWQEKGRVLVEYAQEKLWSEAGAKTLDYLRGRGLADETIRRWQLGYNPTMVWRKRGQWGIEPKDEAMPIEAGVVIPWAVSGVLWRIRIRRMDGEYKQIARLPYGRGAFFGLLTGKPDVFVTEGEIDALTLWQEIGDLADVVTLGSKDDKLSDRWLPALLGIERFWIATDTDKPGAAEYWLKLTKERGQRALPPGGHKDVNDALQAGEDLRAWAVELLARAEDVAGSEPAAAPESASQADGDVPVNGENQRGEAYTWQNPASAAIYARLVEVEAAMKVASGNGQADELEEQWLAIYAELAISEDWPFDGAVDSVAAWREWAGLGPEPGMASEPGPEPAAIMDPYTLDLSDCSRSGRVKDDPPDQPCPTCRDGLRFWQRPAAWGGGWVCAQCHAPPTEETAAAWHEVEAVFEEARP